MLASASPARRRLLRDAGLRFDVIPSDVDESGYSGTDPSRLVRQLAAAKARDVAERFLNGDANDADGADEESGDERVLVLGCDSVLELDGRAYGKPASPTEARKSWARMAGRHGVLHTGHCLVDVQDGDIERETVAVASTTVHFGHPDAEEVAAYVASEEPLRVAGAFTLDGLGGWFVDRIEGDHGAVLGLSLPLLRYMLRDHGVRVTDLWRHD